MKTLLTAFLSLLITLSASAGLTLREIRTASNNVIELFYQSDTLDVNEVDISDSTQWKVNGTPALAVNRVAAAADQPVSDHMHGELFPAARTDKEQIVDTAGERHLAFVSELIVPVPGKVVVSELLQQARIELLLGHLLQLLFACLYLFERGI